MPAVGARHVARKGACAGGEVWKGVAIRWRPVVSVVVDEVGLNESQGRMMAHELFVRDAALFSSLCFMNYQY